MNVHFIGGIQLTKLSAGWLLKLNDPAYSTIITFDIKSTPNNVPNMYMYVAFAVNKIDLVLSNTNYTYSRHIVKSIKQLFKFNSKGSQKTTSFIKYLFSERKPSTVCSNNELV